MQWDTIAQDVRYTLRSLRRDRAFFLIAILIVALGIGANTAIFSVVNALLFRPLPFQGSDRLVLISNSGGDGGLSSVTSRVFTYLDWRNATHSMEDMAAWFAFFDYGTYSLVGIGEPERLIGVNVTQNFLPFLGVKPLLGRNFTEEEARTLGPNGVILSYGLWQRRFSSDPNVIGRSIDLNDKATTIVGVLPAWFDFSSTFTPGSRVDMLVPFPLSPVTDRWGNTLAVLGRMKPHITVSQAQAEFDVINEQIRKAHPDRWTFGAKIAGLRDYLTGRFRRGLLILLGAVGAVLLVGCTNLSNLMLSRATSRRKEMAIRSALGAERSRLVRQMLTESLLISLLGAALGLVFAYAGVRALSSIQGFNIPLLSTVRIDSTALVFTMLVTMVTGLLFGLFPALQISGHQDADALKDASRGMAEGRHTAWTRSALVVSEVALACILLAGAGLLIRSFLHVLDVDLGFLPEHAASWRIDTGQKYAADVQKLALYDRLARAIEAIPGVESAGITDSLPLSRDRSWTIAARGVSYPKGQVPIAHPRLVDWRYLKTMRIPLIGGRYFDAHDTATSEPVIILNEKAARRLWPGQNAVGQIARINGTLRVVGVVGNVRHQALEEEGGLEFYLPITQSPNGSVELVVRTSVPPASVAPAVRAAMRGIDPNLPNAEYHELNELVSRAVSPRRFMVVLLGAFAATGLLLASIGIYGVVSYTVGRRTQEIGIRMALGASAHTVRRQVMTQTIALVSIGISAGVLGALVVSHLMSSLLYRMQPIDPPTLSGTVMILLLVAAAAAYVPALRASRVDPMTALRID
jgi:putative ABC transport system permease protein